MTTEVEIERIINKTFIKKILSSPEDWEAITRNAIFARLLADDSPHHIVTMLKNMKPNDLVLVANESCSAGLWLKGHDSTI